MIALFGIAAAAPFSMPDAFADEGRTSAEAPGSQGLTSSDAPTQVVDLTVSVEEEPKAAASSSGSAKGKSAALYTLEQFMFAGAINWEGYRFTYYSEKVLPGPGLEIPGRHVSEGGYVSDADGYIVLAGSHPKGTVFDTPFGHQGKIYDRGTFGNHLDVYIR